MASVNIKNKKASFEYELIEEYIAGIELKGTEIKSIRQGKASIKESFCQIKNGELYIINMYIDPYEYGTHSNHLSRRQRKLLMKKQEIKKIEKKVKVAGLTLIAKSLFINKKNLAKIQLSLAKGKKLYDKRRVIKERELDRESKRNLKYK
jgi:SsrA-binding protein